MKHKITQSRIVCGLFQLTPFGSHLLFLLTEFNLHGRLVDVENVNLILHVLHFLLHRNQS